MLSKFSQFQRNDLDFLTKVVGASNVSTEESELLINATDAMPGEWHRPDVVVWPQNVEQVSKIVGYANQRRLPVTPRGAGSSLSGNVVPLHHGIVLSFRRMNSVVKIFDKDLQVCVEPGVVYDELNTKLQPFNLFFPPIPAAPLCAPLAEWWRTMPQA